MSHSTSGILAAKPRKPSKDFPLFPHATGRWAKKIRGRFCYFGKVADDPQGQAALEKWLNEKDDLLAGKKPRESDGCLTIKDAVNLFLNAKRVQAESGEITERTRRDWKDTCGRIVERFGRTRAVTDITPAEFEAFRAELAKGWALSTLRLEVQKIRCVFHYLYDAGHIDKPVRFGAFRAPSEKTMRRVRSQAGQRMLEPAELRRLLDDCKLRSKAKSQMRAMILLALNCGFGNTDCATLKRCEVDLDRGWVVHPRSKTGAERRCPLWPETVAALREIYATRPTAVDKENEDLVFLSARGEQWVAIREKACKDMIGLAFARLLTRNHLRRPGITFYALRHVHRTIADEAKDQPACNLIMGHTDGTMASVHRERIDDSRLMAITNHIRDWLFGRPPVAAT